MRGKARRMDEKKAPEVIKKELLADAVEVVEVSEEEDGVRINKK